MASAVVMPRLSDTMTEGKIVKWHKKEGDAVKSGEPIADVETDKATLELECYDDGTLLKIVVAEGQSVRLGAPVAIIGKPGEDFSALLAAAPAPQPQAPAAPAPALAPAPLPAPPAPRPAIASKAVDPTRHDVSVEMTDLIAPSSPKVKASPLARRIARESGIDLLGMEGTGPAGRIIARDVAQAQRRPIPAAATTLAAPPVPGPAPLLAYPEPPLPGAHELSGMRKVVAARLGQAWASVPHFYLSAEVDMEACVALREELKALGVSLSLNDFVLKAAAVGLRRVPEVNRSYVNDTFEQHAHIDVGMAVALPEGLVTPVLRSADQLTLSQIAAQARDFAERARTKRLKPEEYSGGSVTVSNLGMFGVDSFFAIVNPPQSAILAVGKVAARPAVHQGRLVARQRMWLSLSGDHRAIDGALGARYLAAVKEALERPVALMA
jgi:pyruvate dehydrogenase E2 component (dihydrolipoamide acetyltransferase)